MSASDPWSNDSNLPSSVSANNSNAPFTPRRASKKRASSLPPSSPLSDLPSSSPIQNVYDLPPLSSDGIEFSSPIVGSRQERTIKARAKGQKKRVETYQYLREEAQLQALMDVDAEKKQREEATQQKHNFFDSILRSFEDRGYSLRDRDPW